jgi:hypothetical protein
MQPEILSTQALPEWRRLRGPDPAHGLKPWCVSVHLEVTMITPLKQRPGHRGGIIAILVLAVATLVVTTTRPHPRSPAASATRVQPAVPLPGAVLTTGVEPQTKTVVVVDDRSPLIATGSTSYDETRTSHVGVPVHGWLKKTRTTSLGRTVRSGETLGVIYSLDVLFATASVVNQVRDYRGPEPLDAERWRLLRWGMLQPTLSHIENTLTPQASLPLIARLPGTVVAEAGSAVQLVAPSTGLELFTITDPSYTWVFVDVPDAYAARLAIGTPAKLTIDGVARPVTANVAYVYRHSEDGMRKVRFDLHSASTRIKPDVQVTAELAGNAFRPREGGGTL